ncbi:protein PLASTID MOVEMENT IMPAIRED 1 [Prosopis cineraria]|uniref:protein PLASTID MOVEMENT IMPAIRED 1 n=1 Tax=Prosopis cineraria TaxID=364024 RepID=UPI00240FEF61|nr:protein PLASTID MOVEMENT IMPAIRED 1 [Prosopis cineraria]
MASQYPAARNSNAQLLQELEALSQSLYQTHTSSPAPTRRTASLALPRSSLPSIPSADDDADAPLTADKPITKPRSRRLSLSPWRSRSKLEDAQSAPSPATRPEIKRLDERSASAEKKGIWSWKPMRALSHIGMQKLSCLFSVEVVAAQGLPSSMNGLRLSVCVRKKETKDGAVQTMPSRVAQGAADFEETLFIRCHVYCTHGSGKQRLKFEPRPFWIYLFAVDAKEVDFGRSSVDLSQLIDESVEKNQQGTRVRQWDTSFSLSGKARGGELVLKLGFQIMEKDGGIEICNQGENPKSNKLKTLSSSIARKQSKTSFSMPSPRITTKSDTWCASQSQAGEEVDIQGMDDLNLDDPNPVQHSSTSAQKSHDQKANVEDFDLPDFEVVDKGVEVQEKEEDGEKETEKSMDVKSASSEVVKEIVHDQLHLNLTRLSELDSIAQQIKALESMMGEDNKALKTEDETESQRLDADEETVTREFLQMLEDEEIGGHHYKTNQPRVPPLKLEGQKNAADEESKVYLPDLGKGLGCVVQTRDGGCLASMNPLDNVVARKDTPKLAMQISKPFVLPWNQSSSGFELFQKLASTELDELSSQVFTLMPIDELMGKTAEQTAFEGIASAIIQGRNKEGASSSAARIVSALKSMANAMSEGRKERISTGLWNVDENPLTAEKIPAFSLQKIESMAVEALKIQADMAEQEAPFDVSPLSTKTGGNSAKDLFASAVSLEEWMGDQSEAANIAMIMVVQLRDPIRRYEAVGGPVMVVINATIADPEGNDYGDGEEKRFKVTSMHVGGFKLRSGKKKSGWDSEKQRLTAMQWLVAFGLGKGGKKGKQQSSKGQDLLWSISSRIVADMWLKPLRNPDVKLVK